MKRTKGTIALSALLLLSLGSMEAKTSRFGGIRRMTKDTAHKTRNLAGTQIRTAVSAVARGIDQLLYPAAFYVVGNQVVTQLPKDLTPSYPVAVNETINGLPYGTEANNALVRLVAGCVAVAATHAVLTTETMGSFIDSNMPHLSRLLNHVGSENGLKNRRAKEKPL